MGKEYSQTVKQGENVPGDVYGLPSITIRPGDGWGFIDRDMLFEDLAKQGVRQQEEFVERFFTPATSSRRQLPQNLLVFNERAYGVLNVDNPYERDQSTEERLLRSIFGEPDRSAQAEPVVKVSQSEVRLLEKLYDKYALGMRSNGRDEDLGPMNGPLPLTEMINANYLLTTLVIDRMSH